MQQKIKNGPWHGPGRGNKKRLFGRNEKIKIKNRLKKNIEFKFLILKLEYSIKIQILIIIIINRIIYY